MARKGHGRPANLVNISSFPDDGTSPVGSNEWNANRDTTGVIGFTKKTEAISSNAIEVTDSYIEVTNAGDIRTMDQVTTALSGTYYASDTTTKSFGEGDLLYIVKAAGVGTVNLIHQYGSSGGAGKITTLSGSTQTLDVNVPRIFMCRTISGVQEWIEYGGGSASDLDTTNFSTAALVTAADTIASNDNDTTIPTSAAVKDLIEAQIATEDTITELNDTTISGIASGELLKWNGSAWINQTLAEAGIQGTLSNSDIATAVEAASDSNTFTDADHSKLNAIEASATADQSNAEIAAAVEAASDSNTFTDADHTKLNGVAANANNYTHTTNANLTGDVTSSGNATTIAAGAVDIAMLSASGTAGNTTFLRGDNSWQTVASGFTATADDHLDMTGAYSIHDIQTLFLEHQSESFDDSSNDRTNESQLFVKYEDTNNDGLYVRLRVNGNTQNVKIA